MGDGVSVQPNLTVHNRNMLEDRRGIEFRAQLSARFARVRRKRCDIDKSLHTLVDSRGGNYDAAPRMPHKNDGAAGAIQGALYRRDIILQRGQRVLNCDDLEPVRLEERDDFAPGRTVGR